MSSALERGSETASETTPQTDVQEITETRSERDDARGDPTNWEQADLSRAPDADQYLQEQKPWTAEEKAAIDAAAVNQRDSPSPDTAPVELPARTDDPGNANDSGENRDTDAGSRSQSEGLGQPPKYVVVLDDATSNPSLDPSGNTWSDRQHGEYVVIHPGEVASDQTTDQRGHHRPAKGEHDEPFADNPDKPDAPDGHSDGQPDVNEPQVRSADDGTMIVTYPDGTQVPLEERAGHFVPVGQTEEDLGWGPYGPHTPPELTEHDELPTPQTELRPGDTIITRDYYPAGLLGPEMSEPYNALAGYHGHHTRLDTPIEPEQADTPVTNELADHDELPEDADKFSKLGRVFRDNLGDVDDAITKAGKISGDIIPTLHMPHWVERLGGSDLQYHSGDTNIASAALATGVVIWVGIRAARDMMRRTKTEGES